MELRQIKYFLKAAETLNFTQAANEVFISQSTLSQQIKQLEIELGSPLFDRIGKRVALTETGKTFKPYALQAIANAREGQQAVRELNNLESGEIRVGLTYAWSAAITKIIIDFKNTYPKIRLKIVFGTTDELLIQLKELKIDLLCTFLDRTIEDPDFHSEAIFESPMMMVVAANSALAGRKSITLEELAKLPMALPDSGYSTRQYLDTIMIKSKLSPEYDLEINDIPTLFKMVETGKWVTVLTHITVMDQPSLSAIPIKGPKMNREAHLVRLSGLYQSRSNKRFCDLLKENYKH